MTPHLPHPMPPMDPGEMPICNGCPDLRLVPCSGPHGSTEPPVDAPEPRCGCSGLCPRFGHYRLMYRTANAAAFFLSCFPDTFDGKELRRQFRDTLRYEMAWSFPWFRDEMLT